MLAGRYILYVGSEQPRKNVGTLLAAFAELRQDARFRDVALVKVGDPGGPEAPFRARTLRAVSELGLEDDVVFLGHVANEELRSLYAGSQCLVLPSLHEGFGLTPLEAMACGCPAVVSNTTSMPEVAGGAALLVDPRSSRALALALETVLTDERKRRELVGRGLARAQEFSWQRAAAETVRVYERFL